MSSEALGPVGHVAFVVADVRQAMMSMPALRVRWSSVTRPTARLQDGSGAVSEVQVDYVASSGGEPRIKLISAVEGSLFVPASGGAVHHVSYWVDDLEATTGVLTALGWTVEATGLEPDGSPRFRYLVGTDGHRIELGRSALRQEFDAWADG